MKRRRRAVAFMVLSVAAALGAAVIADRYGSSLARSYGPLRPVVVAGGNLAAGRRLGPREVTARLAVRRVPARFIPPGALASPAEALGLAPTVDLPAGSYLLAGQLEPPRRRREGRGGRLGSGRGPVEIAVSGAEALRLGAGRAGKVDVVVTSEPRGLGAGRTYVAAEGVPLLALRPGPEGPGGTMSATLGLTRRQALRLIAAQSFARRVTLLAAGTR